MNTLLLMIMATLTAATPLTLAALGGIFSERTGVINIALEGIMLMSAFAAATASWATGSAFVGILAAVVIGLITAWIHGVMAIRYRADQTVSGVAINILALGLTDFLANKFFHAGQSPSVTVVKHLADVVPSLRNIPIIGQIADLTPFVYLMLVLVPLTSWLLYRTPLGLRMRAVGEKPAAADTVGISVAGVRMFGVLMSGVLGGLAGASLSVGIVSGYTTNMTAGRGFIALAAMIFGNWNPGGALVASLLFGLADAGQVVLQMTTWGQAIPPEFLQMLPYLLTMLALAGVVGRSRAPAADGIPYTKGER